MAMKRYCAWCRRGLTGDDTPTGEPEMNRSTFDAGTHGICGECTAKELAAHAELEERHAIEQQNAPGCA